MPPPNPSLPTGAELRTLDLPDADVRWWPRAFATEEADRLYAALRAGIDWQQEEILIFGKRRRVPRLVAWHGDPGCDLHVFGHGAHAAAVDRRTAARSASACSP